MVSGQFVLLGLLIVADRIWSSPTLDLAGARAVGDLVFFAGLALVLAASLNLGTSLTAHPSPRTSGQLRTSGFYSYVRHPIYSGVLLIGWGLALRSGLVPSLVVAAVLTAWMTVKARYEERLLTERYPGYAEYAARTGRFVPRLSRGGAGGV
jgi:protein-S-isoprenylcysteine O-methyltransferase Ste14